LAIEPHVRQVIVRITSRGRTTVVIMTSYIRSAEEMGSPSEAGIRRTVRVRSRAIQRLVENPS
jgi:hypothetical protein